MAALDHRTNRLDQAATGFRDASRYVLKRTAAQILDAATLPEHARTLDYFGDLLGNTAQASLLDMVAGARNRAAGRTRWSKRRGAFPTTAHWRTAWRQRHVSMREGDDAFAAREILIARWPHTETRLPVSRRRWS